MDRNTQEFIGAMRRLAGSMEGIKSELEETNRYLGRLTQIASGETEQWKPEDYRDEDDGDK